MEVTREVLSAKAQEHISHQVKAFCERNGLKYRDAAERFGMTSSTLNSRINGRTKWTLEDVLFIGYMTGERLIYKDKG